MAMGMSLPPAIFLMGPTASGKTALAVALAARFPVELISVDSALIYRGMDIGTAKPDAATLAVAPHHLIDILDPTEAYSAARFAADARARMDDIVARGRVPLLVGGTMLYFKALAEGLHDLPSASPALRAQIDAEAAQDGWPSMHTRLAALDPETAARLAPHDSQRIGRALEVVLATGEPMSRLLAAQTRAPLPYALTRLALLPLDRAALHARIAERFDLMLEQGLVDEVRALRARYPTLTADLPSMRCVGYRQTWDHLDGVIDAATLRQRGIEATRQLAKRQMTWLRGMAGLQVCDPLASGSADETVLDWAVTHVASAVKPA
jgi:tRNA dimethylallyltransferase